MRSNKDDRHTKHPHKVVVQDPEEIYMAMMAPFEGNDELGDTVLDIEMGSVIYSPVREGWGDEEVEEALANGQVDEEDITLAEKLFENPATRDRYLRIPEGESWWGSQDLTGFIEAIEDPKIRDRFARTIHGQGTFARFKTALQQAGNAWLERWYAYQAEIHEARVREWLKSEGIELIVDPKRNTR